ncbi:MAG TPA: tetratricopeptide repeat protein [Gaiellaceae bacterium]
MSKLPTGTVTFLFTDIEGSTRLLQELGAGYAEALGDHRRALRAAFTRRGGVEVDTQGDAFFVAFERGSDALAAADEARRALAGGPIRVRIGLHTGEAVVGEEGYVGLDVHRAARICAAAHGGQIVLSAAVRDALGEDAAVRDLGLHRLKDLLEPERLYQAGDEAFPPLRSLNATNLPMQSTPLVDREREVAEVVALLRGGARLVTLTGAGGSGKTRLALQAAAELVDYFVDGVFWVALAPLAAPALVQPAIAAILGVRESGGPIGPTLAEHLRGKRLLLLLDNAEHLVAAAPELALLLAGCPYLRLLVTSRSPLRLSGEYEYAVPPLPEDPAVELFRQRAGAVGRTVDGAPAIAEICRRLDGLPLAIELAAAWTRILSPEGLLERLDPSLPLLAGGPRDVPARQRTLRATIDWSYELLEAEERKAFARLGVFAGGWALEAAEQVCGTTLETLSGLVEKSLVRAESDGRFVMLETIREYALERLVESGEEAELRDQHAGFFLRVAEEAGPELSGPEQSRWLGLLEAEHPNLRAAADRFGEIGAVDDELRLVSLLWRFWRVRGHLGEGRARLERAIGRGASARADLRAEALYAAGCLADAQGDHDGAASLTDRSLALARELGETRLVAASLNVLGSLAVDEGRHADAFAQLQESADLFRELEDARSVAVALQSLGRAAVGAGDYSRAAEHYEESAARFHEVGDVRGTAVALLNAGDLALNQGEYDVVEARCEQSRALFHDLGDTWGEAISLVNLGFARLRRGSVDHARSTLDESLRLAHELGAEQLIALGLEGLAAIACTAGEAELAARLLGAAEAQLETTEGAQPFEHALHEETLAAARAALGDGQLASALAAGRELGLAQSAVEALASAQAPHTSSATSTIRRSLAH